MKRRRASIRLKTNAAAYPARCAHRSEHLPNYVLLSSHDWLQASQEENKWVLLCASRLRRLVNGLRDTTKQYPSLMCFVRRGAKAQALRQVFPANNHGRRRGTGVADLRVDSVTVDTDWPVFFAGANLNPSVEGGSASSHCYKVTKHAIDRTDADDSKGRGLSELVDRLYTRLPFLFTDVLDLFADDLGGLDGVAEKMGSRLLCPRRLARVRHGLECSSPRADSLESAASLKACPICRTVSPA